MYYKQIQPFDITVKLTDILPHVRLKFLDNGRVEEVQFLPKGLVLPANDKKDRLSHRQDANTRPCRFSYCRPSDLKLFGGCPPLGSESRTPPLYLPIGAHRMVGARVVRDLTCMTMIYINVYRTIILEE